MPPVLGPVSPSPTRLWSWAGAERHRPLSVADGEQRHLRSDQALLDDHRRAGRAERRAGQLGARRRRSASARSRGDEHALAGGQPVGLHDEEAGQLGEEGRRPVLLLGPKAPWRAVGTPAATSSSFIQRLRPLEAGAVGPRPEHQLALGPQPVGQPVDERHLGPDHEQVGVELLGGAATDPGMPGLPGVTTHLVRTDADRATRPGRAPARPLPDQTHGPRRQASRARTHVLVSRPGPTHDEADRYADLLGSMKADVVAGLAGSSCQLGGAGRVLSPTRQLLVHRRGPSQHGLAGAVGGGARCRRCRSRRRP